jgi:SAM-dependent methyltransferase
MLQPAEQLTPLPDATKEVRDFYDRHPYPPPIDNLEEYQRHWQDPRRRRADFHLFQPSKAYRADQSILIAGCGTSQAAKHALRWPAAQVTGIDCSATSVQHTKELERRHGIRNLQVHQLALEHVSELGLYFDQVVCTGVLHHLADPDAGLTALRNVLKPDGAMEMMVYAPYGRAGIYMLQEFCRRIGVQANNGEIRDLITALRALPPGHPVNNLLAHAPELQSEEALADALLHPRDRAYSVPQLFDFIESAGLTFGRWLRQAPYSTYCGVIPKLPQAPQIARLPLREQFATIELFRGTMIRHSAIVYRNDRPSTLKTVRFAGTNWLSYVPIRIPDTVCVEDHLPPEAAGVLINRTHTYRDIFLPIGATEKRLFDAIDGNNSIAEIAGNTFSSSERQPHLALTRHFFERLWWHDQVLFDASQET